jgi:protease II
VDDTGRTDKLYRHTIGENAPDGSDDELIYQEKDERYILKISTSNNRKYFLLHVHGQITREIQCI